MLVWLAANAGTIVISLIVLVLLGFAVRHMYRHRGSCGCGCEEGCSGHCSSCHGDIADHKSAV